MRKFVVALAAFLALANTVYGQKPEIFQKKSKFGVRENEKVIIKPQYEDIKLLSDNYFAIKVKGQYGVINKLGTIIVPEAYDDLMYYGDNNFLVRKDNKWGIINRLNKLVLPIQYTGFKFINDRLCEIKSNNKIGLITKYGDVVMPASYDSIELFAENTFLVKKDGKCGIFDDFGKSLVPTLYDSFTKMDNSDLYSVKLGNKIGIMDSSYKLLLDASYDQIESGPLGMTLYQGDKIGFYTSNGQVIQPVYSRILFIQPEFGLAVVKEGTKLGFVTSQGVVVPAQYENISRFSNRGIAFVEKSGKLMAVNVDGREMTVQETMGSAYPQPPK